jgi:hypothetical protein
MKNGARLTKPRENCKTPHCSDAAYIKGYCPACYRRMKRKERRP